MTTTMTKAEEISALLGGDGTTWATKDGLGIGDLCVAAGAGTTRVGGCYRWDFEDGSSIVAAGPGGWDLGLPGGCACWAGANRGAHADDCCAR